MSAEARVSAALLLVLCLLRSAPLGAEPTEAPSTGGPTGGPAAGPYNAGPNNGVPLWMQSIAESTDCLRSVDANPAFAAIRPRIPTAEAMGLAGIENRAKPSPREQEIVVRYAEAAASCIPQFLPDDNDPVGRQIAPLVTGLWDRQTALLRQLAEGTLTWGRYNRETMVLDRQLRREMAAIRKPVKPPAPRE